MAYLKSLPDEATVPDILRLNTAAGRALVDYHTAVMRQPSELSPGDRELIAAFVSGLNACQYCHGVHSATAREYGVPQELLPALVEDLDSAAMDEKLRPILAYARKLTLEPSKVVQSDADAVLAAGWSEQTLHDAITVTCLYNFMNRLLDGHGTRGNESLFEARGKGLKDNGYAPLLDLLKD